MFPSERFFGKIFKVIYDKLSSFSEEKGLWVAKSSFLLNISTFRDFSGKKLNPEKSRSRNLKKNPGIARPGISRWPP